MLCTKSHMKRNDLGKLNLKVPKRYNMRTLSQETWNDLLISDKVNFRAKNLETNTTLYNYQIVYS